MIQEIGGRYGPNPDWSDIIRNLTQNTPEPIQRRPVMMAVGTNVGAGLDNLLDVAAPIDDDDTTHDKDNNNNDDDDDDSDYNDIVEV